MAANTHALEATVKKAAQELHNLTNDELKRYPESSTEIKPQILTLLNAFLMLATVGPGSSPEADASTDSPKAQKITPSDCMAKFIELFDNKQDILTKNQNPTPLTLFRDYGNILRKAAFNTSENELPEKGKSHGALYVRNANEIIEKYDLRTVLKNANENISTNLHSRRPQ